MVASVIEIEPNSGGAVINYTVASYRQIRFEVVADSLVPPDQPMYADVYINGDFYQTLSTTTILNTGGMAGTSLFVFDIQSTVQAYIQQFVPDLSTGSFVIPGFSIQSDSVSGFQQVTVLVYFRGSTISGGLLTPEATPPTQGTATTAPVNTFSGLACGTFNVAKATIMPDFESVFDNENTLEEKLFYNLQYTPAGSTRIYGLCNLPLDKAQMAGGNWTLDLCPTSYTDQQGGFPIIIMEFDASGMLSTTSRSCSFYIQFSVSGINPIPLFPNGGTILLYGTPQTLTSGTWYIPLGLKEILTAQPTLAPIFNNPANNVYYRILVNDDDAGQTAYITPTYKAVQNPTISDQNTNVLWFQNAYGHFEQVPFVRMSKELVVTSTEQFTPYTQTGSEFLTATNNYLQVGHKKYNVRANDEITLTALFTEQLIPWLRELFMSPYILMKIADPRTSVPNPSSATRYLLQAVTIMDATFVLKLDPVTGGKKYLVTVKVKPAVDYIVPRN